MSEDAGARAAGGAALSPRVRAIVAIGLLGLLLGFLWGIADVPRYTASASVLVTSKGGEPAGEAELEAAAQLAQSAEVAATAAGLIGGDVAGADLLSDIDVAADPSAGAVRIDADSDSPDFAAAAANGYALALVEVGGKRYEEGAQASIPDSPSEDRSAPLWALIGLLAGLLLGFAVTAVRSRTAGAEPAKPRPKAAPSAGESPAALARLGDPARLLVRSGEASEFNPAALGDLAAAAAALGLDDADGPRRVAAVGVGAGGGALEVLVGLAVLAGERGLRTILVEADLDAPVLAARTGASASPGLSDYLRGAAGPRDVLRNAPVRVGGERATVVCVPAGDPGSQPLDGVGGERFASLIDRLPRVYDLVLVLAPPAGGEDAAAVAKLVDGVVVVAADGSELTAAARDLPRSRFLGGVLVASAGSQSHVQSAGLRSSGENR